MSFKPQRVPVTLKGMNAIPKPVMLLVLDGLGVSLQERGNPFVDARKPNLEALERRYPFILLQASGVAVGLPWGEAGNSEVGHLTMGAGRVIYHHLPRIIVAIRDGSFYQNPAFRGVSAHVQASGGALHLLGLVSSGSVHSYIDHLYALMEFAAREQSPRVFLHVITDGKDAPPQEGREFLQKLQERIETHYPAVRIASLLGRFYAMDRDEQWDRIRQAYELLVEGKGAPFTSAPERLAACYARGVSDEFVEPAYLAAEDGTPIGRVQPGDGLILFNFREDSMREITAALAKDGFDAFPRTRVQNLKIATMTEYDKSLVGVAAAFPPLEIHWPLSRAIAAAGMMQLHIAESEKYAHVTYFFNGGTEKPFVGEDRLLVSSLPVARPDERPEMQVGEIVARIEERIGQYDFILANLANADIVGHTGNYGAVVKAIEAVDAAVGELVGKVLAAGGILLITADHGNAEQKMNPLSGEPLTEHTANPVPFFLVGKAYALPRERSAAEVLAIKKETAGILTDVAPTVLELMGIPEPEEMTGKSLLGMLTQRKGE